MTTVQEVGMRYRLDVVAPSVADVVASAGGWLVDRVMAGWDVTVLISGAPSADELRPLQILGVEIGDLESAMQQWEQRPHPQTVAVAADLFASNEQVREGVRGALEQGLTEVTLWGESWPSELDAPVDCVQHELSSAARAFKAQAMNALGSDGAVAGAEVFRCGVMTRPSVAADLVPAS